MKKVYIDGSNGTTGLRIHERLKDRDDIELLIPDEEHRKNTETRKEYINNADVAILCLPDLVSKETIPLVENPDTVIIDTSTAHRTAEGWTYGLPELTGQREKIKNSKRIANPGCHATGFITLVAPLVEDGIIPKELALSCFSLTGYSGGGKKMIAEYEADDLPLGYDAPRLYGIGQEHKHLPEMQKICGLNNAPIFCPIVAGYYSGMEVSVPLFKKDINGNAKSIMQSYRNHYSKTLIRFTESMDVNGFISASSFEGYDNMQITIQGSKDRYTLIALFDNLGKGASGAAIQNMNIVLGVNEYKGLNLKQD